MFIIHKPFYFMRHGETEWNKKCIHMGQTNIPLNETGRVQASRVDIKNKPIGHIATSPLIRAYETAQIINRDLGLPITVVDELKECSFGLAEGNPYDDGTLIQQWIKGADFEGGESRIVFEKRILSGITKAMNLSPLLLSKNK